MTAKNRRIKRLRERLAKANSDIRTLVAGGVQADLLIAQYKLKYAMEANIEKLVWAGDFSAHGHLVTHGIIKQANDGTMIHIEPDKTCIICGFRERGSLNQMCNDCLQRWLKDPRAK